MAKWSTALLELQLSHFLRVKKEWLSSKQKFFSFYSVEESPWNEQLAPMSYQGWRVHIPHSTFSGRTFTCANVIGLVQWKYTIIEAKYVHIVKSFALLQLDILTMPSTVNFFTAWISHANILVCTEIADWSENTHFAIEFFFRIDYQHFSFTLSGAM